MKTRRVAACIVSMLLFAGAQAPAAGAQELSAKEIKKIQKQADKAFGGGQHAAALELYEQLLAATPPGDSRRAEALYAVAMARISPASPPRDVDGARPYLEELATSFPRHPRRLEVAALRAGLEELDAARGGLEAAAAKMAEKEAAFAAEQAERERIEAERAEIADESEAADGRVKSLAAQLRKVKAELAETRLELETKEEALQKLKEALVGRAGGSN